MANIRIRNTNKRLTKEQEVTSFLDKHGVLYEHWDMDKLSNKLRNQFLLSNEDKEEILRTYDDEIRSLANRRGYAEWDVVALSDATPNLDELLKKFENVHVHTEDEVRAITAGNGIFTIKGEEGYFDVELSPGDVISVPVNTPHFFTLMENRQVVAVRLFIDSSGWVAHPYEDPEFKQ
ncbi:1,2-dihydroxy-3-keto-5-methylthiopentene dioxygenase [Neobacillus niacini]|uniref:1,2-dihydroxy-3-keto-5-methylthiopentene dioxygenase n=1 Tax=Neobacillus driksii TaxID=3035913 RepID=UPI002781DE51|nr:cupin domain-containing protein [Neobacillus niacini]MDQ0973339.1 1,2-dihydroxy-3-keto-5-methylthiopentene dioxygenase [Neobacillus niacini]